VKKPILIALSIALSLSVFSQRRNNNYSMMNSKKNSDVFPDALHIKYTGWHLGIGLTEMKPQTLSVVANLASNAGQKPSTKTGYYIDLGGYKLFEYFSLFRYMDWGLGYKSLRGKELNTSSSFGDHFVSGYLNLNNTVNIGKYTFWGNTIGINTDYALGRNLDYGDSPNAFQAAIHYKLTLGYKVTKSLVIIPAIETPILTLYPFEYGSSSLKYLSSRYRPIILSIRFMFLRQIRDICPPVYAPGMLEEYTPTDMGN
jgi:hypothetical protein